MEPERRESACEAVELALQLGRLDSPLAQLGAVGLGEGWGIACAHGPATKRPRTGRGIHCVGSIPGAGPKGTRSRKCMVARGGLEPPHTRPEPAVLPIRRPGIEPRQITKPGQDGKRSSTWIPQSAGRRSRRRRTTRSDPRISMASKRLGPLPLPLGHRDSYYNPRSVANRRRRWRCTGGHRRRRHTGPVRRGPLRPARSPCPVRRGA